MIEKSESSVWQPGTAPVAVVMISLNEGHNMEAVLENLKGWAQEVFLVDSYSKDDTVDIALRYGVHVVQRKFRGFGDQWNFALRELPITAPWTMKLDPDERLSDELKRNLIKSTRNSDAVGFVVVRRLWFMGKTLPVTQQLLRVWESGKCRFTDVAVNEHPLVNGKVEYVNGDLEHHDSPDLDHWLEKQNRYTTAEAITRYRGDSLAAKPRLFGSRLQRRMLIKKNFTRLPFRFSVLFSYHFLWQGAWRAGWEGYTWSKLRLFVMRLREYKYREMLSVNRMLILRY